MIDKELFDGKVEAAVLHTLILSPGKRNDIFDIVVPDDFFVGKYRRIYEHLKSLNDNDIQFDSVTIHQFATTNGLDMSDIDLSPSMSSGYMKRIKHLTLLRSVEMLTFQLQDILTAGGTKTDEEIVDMIERKVNHLSKDVGDDEFQSLYDVSTIALTDIADKMSGKSVHFKLGYSDIDKFCVMEPGELLILAGRPGSGKSVLSMNFAERHQGPVGIISLEMTKKELVKRSLSSLSSIELNKIRLGKLNQLEYDRVCKSAQKLSKKIYIDDEGGVTVLDIKRKLRAMKRKFGISLAIIDHLQLVHATRHDQNKNNDIADITNAAKALAKELDIAIIVLSQLNRNCESRENKRPMLSDLRDSGAIEQDADTIMLIYRDDYYNKESTAKNICEINVAKQRNGETGTVKLLFKPEYMRFYNLESVIPEGVNYDDPF